MFGIERKAKKEGKKFTPRSEKHASWLEQYVVLHMCVSNQHPQTKARLVLVEGAGGRKSGWRLESSREGANRPIRLSHLSQMLTRVEGRGSTSSAPCLPAYEVCLLWLSNQRPLQAIE